MRPLTELKSFTREAARILSREKDLASYEIYCATAEHRIARLAYTSDIPSRGLEEFKSLHADGFQLRIAMRRNPHEVGAASEAGVARPSSIRIFPGFRRFRLVASRRCLRRAILREWGTVRSLRLRGTCSRARLLHSRSAPRTRELITRV
jgi:hypothetical protein